MKTFTLSAILATSVAFISSNVQAIDYNPNFHTDFATLYSTFGKHDEEDFIKVANILNRNLERTKGEVSMKWDSPNGYDYELQLSNTADMVIGGVSCHNYAFEGPDHLWTEGYMCKSNKTGQWSIK